MALYDQVYLFCNGQLLAENTTVDTSLEGDDQDVATIPKGWTGQSPSPKTRKVSADNVIPASGMEFDFESKYLNTEEVEIMMALGNGKKCTTRGYLRNVKISAGVGKTVSMSFEYTGTPSAFE